MTVHHEPALFRSRRFGCWATCECGRWHSRRWTTTIGAHIEFGEHLVAAAKERHA